jgi:diguanylate cyclase (GGDEF)-like protein/PAS domain S-box-containing protein
MNTLTTVTNFGCDGELKLVSELKSYGVKVDTEGADGGVVPATTEPMMSAAPVLAPGTLPPGASPQASHVYELLRAAAELVFLVDPNKRVVYAGQSLSAMLGYDPLQVIGHPLGELVHPNHAAPLEAAMEQVFRGTKLGAAELRWPHRSGRGSLPLMVSFSNLGQGNVTEGTMVTASHANTTKAVEAALSFDDETAIAAGETSPVVLFLLDERGRCTWINGTWTALSGQSSDAAKGLGWLNMLDEGDRAGFRSVAAQAHQKKMGWRQQFRLRSAAGELYWIDGASAPRFALDGTVAGYIVALADITAEVRARAELNKRTTIVESNAEFVVMDERSQRLVYGTEEQASPLASTPPVPAMDQAEAARPSLGALASAHQAEYLNVIRPAVLSDGVWQPGVVTPRASLGLSHDDRQAVDDLSENTPDENTTTENTTTENTTTENHPPANVPAPSMPVDTLPSANVDQLLQDIVDSNRTVGVPPAITSSSVNRAVIAPMTNAPTATAAPSNAPSAPPVSTPAGVIPSAQPVAWNFDAPDTPEGPVKDWQGPSWKTAPAPHEASADANASVANEQVYVGLVGPSGSVESIASVSDSVLEPTEFEVADMLPAMDSVTGLANRALFQERIRLAMHRMSRDGVSIAVMLANLHGYDELRQQVGSKTGDDQLFVIGKRLEATIRQVDTAARIGDADFALLGVGWFFPGDVENAARRFMVKIQEPLPSVGRQAVVLASMGIAMAQPDETISTLLRRAQRARKIAYGLGAGHVYVDNGPGREPTQS